MNIVSNTNLSGFVLKVYDDPPKLSQLEADLLSNGWVRGLLLATRQGYILLGLRYGGWGGEGDLAIQVRPLDWLPENGASPYRLTHIFTVRKHRDIAEQLEEDEVLVINDLYDDEAYILSRLDLPPLGTVQQTQRLTLQVKAGWFHQNTPHPLR